MPRPRHLLVRLSRDQRGTETLEWGLACGLLIIGAIAVMALIGPRVASMWNDLSNEIPTSGP